VKLGEQRIQQHLFFKFRVWKQCNVEVVVHGLILI
jgi:hypothetical protein